MAGHVHILRFYHIDTVYNFDGEAELKGLYTTVTGIGRTVTNEIVVLLSGYGPLVLREDD